jgi:hypothetical protein
MLVKNANTRAQVVDTLVLAHRNKGVEKRVESVGLGKTGCVRHRDRTRPVFVSAVVFQKRPDTFGIETGCVRYLTPV